MKHVRRQGSFGFARRWWIYVIAAGVWLSGGLWLLFHYFLQKQGEFGPSTNPLEPWWLKMHGAFAFASLWMGGLIWGVHITRFWPGRRRRWSGSILTAVFALLILTGYLLYYVADDHARPMISYIHWIIGLLCPTLFLWHRWARTRVR